MPGLTATRSAWRCESRILSLTHVPLSCRYRCAAVRLLRIAPVRSNPQRAEATPLYQSRRLPSSRWRGTPQTSGDTVLYLQLSCLIMRGQPIRSRPRPLFWSLRRGQGEQVGIFRRHPFVAEQEGPLTPYGKLYVCPRLIPRPPVKWTSRDRLVAEPSLSAFCAGYLSTGF